MPLPLAATSDTAGILTDLFLVLLAAKLGDEVFKRIGQPAIVGEILGGVLVGPSVLDWVQVSEVLRVFSELGVVFLLFWVGLETRLSEMKAVGRIAVTVGSAGVVLPFLAGVGFGLALGESTETSVFLGAALAATSAGITSATFLDLGIARSRAARTVLGAAVVDDILALILLSVAVGMAADGGVDAGKIALALAIAVAFVVFVALGGTQLLARRPQLLQAPAFANSPLLPAVLVCLGLAAFAANIGLAALIGAFLAGMIVAETKDHNSIEEEVRPLYAFFPPFFFAFIGIELDLGTLLGGHTLLLLAAITVIAAAAKLIPAYLAARPLGKDEAMIVGVGMIPRGEVGIVVASIGAAEGVVDPELFGVVVGMSILTTLIAPFVLRRLSRPGAKVADIATNAP
ncbi:MAG TPA: cation:proton antiporter [Solirubrobacterales bacterium]|nr:cation:proton antiporter [Solirubrobacterales bacterium]